MACGIRCAGRSGRSRSERPVGRIFGRGDRIAVRGRLRGSAHVVRQFLEPLKRGEGNSTAFSSSCVQNGKPASRRVYLVGATGFEPATSSSRTKRATKLRYAPTVGGEDAYFLEVGKTKYACGQMASWRKGMGLDRSLTLSCEARRRKGRGRAARQFLEEIIRLPGWMWFSKASPVNANYLHLLSQGSCW